MRNIRDYKASLREDQDILGSASPFNIVSESLALRDFTRDEVGVLYRQHTSETGQEFSNDVIDRAFYFTQGQPWLVNAVAREIVMKLLKNDNQAKILPDHPRICRRPQAARFMPGLQR